MQRLYYLDNIRWVTILLVMLFHVFYYYNAYCFGTGIGSFSDYQPQDAILYLLYPWMMPLLFTVAGMSSRYAPAHQSPTEYLRARTRKLLVPATLGIFVFQWIAGYCGMLTMNYRFGTEMAAGQPWWVVYLVCAVSGGGGLWFIHLLWLFSLLTLLFNRFEKTTGTAISLSEPTRRWVYTGVVCLFGVLLWLSAQTVLEYSGDIQDPRIFYNLYRPLYYLTAYLFGYFFFSREGVQTFLSRFAPYLLPVAIGCGVWLTVTTFGQDAYSTAYLRSVGNNLYAFLMIITVLGSFRRWFDRTSPASRLLHRISYGLYLLQFAVYMGIGYVLRACTTLPPWSIYLLLGVAVFTLTPMLYFLIHKTPVLRYCVLGEK